MKITACLALAAVALSATAQTDARRFVQSFYDWYVPHARDLKSGSPEGMVLKKRPTALAPELRRALKRWSNAEEKSKDGVVGPDFDVFLNSQDPYEHYFAREVTKKKNLTLVNIYGGQSKKPALIAELRRDHGKWQFVDFVYGDGPSLRALLKEFDKPKF